MAENDTFRTYFGDGVTTDYSIPFTYERTDEVVIKKNGVLTTAWTFVNPSILRMNTALLNTDTITVQRVTNIDAPAVAWKNGSGTTGGQLNAMARQLLNSMQESRDTANRGLFRLPNGVYDFTFAKATNLGVPTDPTDAANKQYVDAIVGATQGSAADAAISAAIAEEAEIGAVLAKDMAASDRVKASQWADGATNFQVETGKYSAKHWAGVAQAIAAQSAAGIGFTPYSTIAATNVQAAIQELADEKAQLVHDHDSRYFTETESDARFLGLTATAANSDKLATLTPTTFGGQMLTTASRTSAMALLGLGGTTVLASIATAGNASAGAWTGVNCGLMAFYATSYKTMIILQGYARHTGSAVISQLNNHLLTGTGLASTTALFTVAQNMYQSFTIVFVIDTIPGGLVNVSHIFGNANLNSFATANGSLTAWAM